MNLIKLNIINKNIKAMEEEILKIGTRLKDGNITDKEAKNDLMVLVGVSGSLATLNEALNFIQQANNEYSTYYSSVDGEVKEVSKLADDLASVIKNYQND